MAMDTLDRYILLTLKIVDIQDYSHYFLRVTRNSIAPTYITIVQYRYTVYQL